MIMFQLNTDGLRGSLCHLLSDFEPSQSLNRFRVRRVLGSKEDQKSMTTYSISLDDVDLALLPTRSRSNDFLKKEHFQFELMSKENSASEPATSAQHPCHICAIDVPTEHLDGHFASVKHRANVRIATEASQRMRAFINTNPPLTKPQPTAKFCDSCSTVAGKDHDKTKAHTIAVIHDRILCDLMKIYVGEGHLKSHDNRESEVLKDESETVNEETLKLGNEVAQTETDNNNEPNPDSVPKTVIQRDDNIDDVMGNGEANVPPDFLKIDNETYIKLLNNVPSFPKVVIQAVGDKIQILVDGERLNVSSDHFHSYHRMEGKIQCRVCYCTITPAEEETHKLSVTHMKRVIQVVGDSHCVREIYANWCHCILCNQVVKSTLVETHTLTDLHRENRTRATVIQVQSSTVRDVKDIQNTAATSGIQSTNVLQNAAKKTEVHAQNTSKFVAVNKPKAFSQNNYHSKEEMRIEYPYKATENPNSVYCLVCECAVPSKLSNRVDHLKGLRHAQSTKFAKK